DQGVQGAQGVQGVQGVQGPQGDQGEQGEPGETLNWADVIETGNLQDAVYIVGVLTDEGPLTAGTAFSAYFTDKLWTNAHVVTDIVDAINDPEFAELNPVPFVTRTGTLIGGDETYIWRPYIIHPEYDGSLMSADVALIEINGTINHAMPVFLPREFTDDLRVGQPVGTLGFPALPRVFDALLPQASFKDGTISAIRPLYNESFINFPINTGHLVHYNLATRGGTSGSPVFDHQGFIIAINHAGIREIIPYPEEEEEGENPSEDEGEGEGEEDEGEVDEDEEEDEGGGADEGDEEGEGEEEEEEEPGYLASTSTLDNFGINISLAWDLLDFLASVDATVTNGGLNETDTVEAGSQSQTTEYQAFPKNWNGETWLP
ncbi:MAG: serine protease, partial [Gemmatimonadetes bacterium]|nr:serine protease [Gemmatimonadota bacterium]